MTLPNAPLAERMQDHLELVGGCEYTEEEISFVTDRSHCDELVARTGRETSGSILALIVLGQ